MGLAWASGAMATMTKVTATMPRRARVAIRAADDAADARRRRTRGCPGQRKTLKQWTVDGGQWTMGAADDAADARRRRTRACSGNWQPATALIGVRIAANAQGVAHCGTGGGRVGGVAVAKFDGGGLAQGVRPWPPGKSVRRPTGPKGTRQECVTS